MFADRDSGLFGHAIAGREKPADRKLLESSEGRKLERSGREFR